MKNFGMFTDEGNQLVTDLTSKVLQLPITASDKKIYSSLTEGFNDIETKGHGEVWDTDVRERLISHIEFKTKRELTIYF